MNLPDFYQPAVVTDVSDPEDSGRVKVTFQKTGVEYKEWISVQDSVFTDGSNGWFGKLAVNDEVLVAFIDWPTCQIPFVDKKVRSKQNSVKRSGKQFLKINGHKLEFSSSEVKIEHSNGSTVTVATDGMAIDLKGNKYTVKNAVGNELTDMNKTLITTLQSATVMTPFGPQTFMPPTQTLLQQLLIKIMTFLT